MQFPASVRTLWRSLLNQLSLLPSDARRPSCLENRPNRPTPPLSSSPPWTDWAEDPDITVSEVYQRYRIAKQSHRSIGEIERIFARHIIPAFGTRPISGIDRTAITRLLDQIAEGAPRPAPVMARAVAAQLSAFFSWSAARLAFLPDNPCRLAAKPRRPKPRSRVLSQAELRALWSVLDQERPPWNIAIKLILLTGQRRGEIFDAEWAEFDLEQRVFTIPAERSKNGREHQVPLSKTAVELLSTIPRGSTAKLFPARGNSGRGASGFSKALKRINSAVHGTSGGVTFSLQDLRRTVATGLQRLGTQLEVTEAVLNHVSGTRAGLVGVYQLYQFEVEKRAALDRWAVEIERVVHAGSARLGGA